MLNAYSANQTVATGAIIPFTTTTLKSGCTATLNGNAVSLNSKGLYQITFMANGLPTSAGDATISMTVNGTIQPQAISNVANAVTTTGVTLPISTLVRVQKMCCQNTLIQFINNGVPLSEMNASVAVVKLA